MRIGHHAVISPAASRVIYLKCSKKINQNICTRLLESAAT